MLKLQPIDTSEIEILTVAKIACCSCTKEEHITAANTELAATAFFQLGWRTYETNDEINGNTCPQCVADMQELERAGELD
jgi:hypothetical protein